MKTGSLREIVYVERAVKVATDAGDTVATWNPLAKLHAQVKPLSGREQIQAGGLVGTTVYTVSIRYRNDIETSDRIVWRDKIMNIRSVLNPDMKKQETIMLCDEGVPS